MGMPRRSSQMGFRFITYSPFLVGYFRWPLAGSLMSCAIFVVEKRFDYKLDLDIEKRTKRGTIF